MSAWSQDPFEAPTAGHEAPPVGWPKDYAELEAWKQERADTQPEVGVFKALEHLSWKYQELRDRVEEVREHGIFPQARQACRSILKEHDEAVAVEEES